MQPKLRTNAVKQAKPAKKKSSIRSQLALAAAGAASVMSARAVATPLPDTAFHTTLNRDLSEDVSAADLAQSVIRFDFEFEADGKRILCKDISRAQLAECAEAAELHGLRVEKPEPSRTEQIFGDWQNAGYKAVGAIGVAAISAFALKIKSILGRKKASKKKGAGQTPCVIVLDPATGTQAVHFEWNDELAATCDTLKAASMTGTLS